MKSLTKSEITLEILKSSVYLEDFEISYASSPSGKPLVAKRSLRKPMRTATHTRSIIQIARSASSRMAIVFNTISIKHRIPRLGNYYIIILYYTLGPHSPSGGNCTAIFCRARAFSENLLSARAC